MASKLVDARKFSLNILKYVKSMLIRLERLIKRSKASKRMIADSSFQVRKIRTQVADEISYLSTWNAIKDVKLTD